MSKETVVVGCKLPNGIIMQVGEQSHVIKGFNHSAVIGGHGITEDVPKDLWDAWLKENKDRDLCKNGFIFAHSKVTSTKAEATEKKATKSKTEPLEQKFTGEVTKA
ncbi:hypothetical protein AAEX37_01961 [Oligella sp. MSHR50489EDL]|uniref:hypothetical protein n=1 Tax=Oligella sp. MSHR50489EDL TaxID=3139409 RepID=UPI003D814D1B